MEFDLHLVKVFEFFPLLRLQLVLLLQPLDPAAGGVAPVLEGPPSEMKIFKKCRDLRSEKGV